MREVNIHISAYVNDLRIGAYGALIEESGRMTIELSGSHKPTTPRRARLYGVVSALKSLRDPCEVTIYVDSEYIVDAFNKDWVEAWSLRDWHTSNGSEAKNADLWGELLDLIEKHNVYIVLVSGQSSFEYGHEYNARCRYLAIDAVKVAI